MVKMGYATILSMPNQIHPQAVLGKNIKLGDHNLIGPGAIIEDGAQIGSHNQIMAHAFIAKGTTIGDNNAIHFGAIIGHAPQDLAYQNEETFTLIGNQNVIREYVTIHRGTKAGTSTTIGNNNFLMANVHVAHNCTLGNQIIMVNLASLTGHCHVHDQAFISGMTGFHQFSKIGRLAMVSALSAVNKDIPPFMICGGRPGIIQGINVVGMRRAGISQTVRTEIKEAYRLLYRSGLNVSQAVGEIEIRFSSPETKSLLHFIKESKRGICDGQGSAQETLLSKKAGRVSNSEEDFEAE